MSDNEASKISRREFLRGAALGAAGVAVAPALLTTLTGTASAEAPPKALTASEFQVLTALVDRLIPADATGPGAVEARAHVYIDQALAGDYKAALPSYKQNLAAVEAYAQKTYGKSLTALSAADQDDVVTALEAGKIPGVESLIGVNIPAIKFALFPEIQGTFFSVLNQHTHEGMFGDPMYGGNRNFIGWDLLGYPGVNPAPTVQDQAVGTLVPLAHRSDHAFGGRPAQWSLPEHPAPKL
jgi:gluconate 2-dehydrogenase gamma chain